MNYQTQLMQKILTNEKAQEIIDYVSQIYGDSYVGLWLFQSIGSVLGPLCDLSAQLRSETNPAMTSLLITYWETEYGLMPDDSLTLEQRRERIMAIIGSRGPCTPSRLAKAVSGALSVPVEITERTGKNQFRVMVRGAVRSLEPAKAIINKMKPAHLTYTIVGIEQANASFELSTGAAITQGVQYKVEVQ